MKEYGKKRMSIKEWPEKDKPRERLLDDGEHTLSNTELMAILLGTGRKGENAVGLSREILKTFRNFRMISTLETADLKKIKGLGLAKIARIKAAIEIGKRFTEETLEGENPIVRTSREIAGIMMPRMRDLPMEVLNAVFLNSQNRIISICEIVEGTVNKVHPMIRKIFYKAIKENAVSLICCHNHPSGEVCPSPQDCDFTKRLCEIGNVLEIPVLDHLIIGKKDYYSFADSGKMRDIGEERHHCPV